MRSVRGVRMIDTGQKEILPSLQEGFGLSVGGGEFFELREKAAGYEGKRGFFEKKPGKKLRANLCYLLSTCSTG